MSATSLQVGPERRLQGSKCSRCGNVSFPAMTVCPKCGPTHASEVKLVELPSAGSVVTWTKLQVTPTGFPSPLLLCVVDLGEVKVLGSVQGASEVRAGDKVRIVEDPAGKLPFQLALSKQ